MTELPRLTLVTDTTESLFQPLIDSWILALTAEGKSPKTVSGYTLSMQLFIRWLTDHHAVTEPAELTTDQCRGFLAHQYDTRSPATAKTRWTGLTSFCRWAAEEDEITPNPMAIVKSPHVPEKPAAMITTEQLEQLIKGCDGKLFIDKRDVALISMYADTGARLAELARLELDAVDLKERHALVMGKGRKVRILPFGVKTARALDRYIRIRGRQKFADSTALWLSGKDGKAITTNAIQQMFRRRGKAILEIDNLHPHMLRHLFADLWLRGDGQETDLMSLAGWKSRQMVVRYGAATQAERARANYQKGRSPIDNL